MQTGRQIPNLSLDRYRLQYSASNILKRAELFKLIVEFSNDWVFWLNEDLTVRYMSPSCKFITGYDEEEFLEPSITPIEKIIHPNDAERFKRQKELIQQGLNFYSDEFRIITKFGKVRWISHICQSVYDADDRFLGRLATNRDITEKMESVCKNCALDDKSVLNIYENASIGYYHMYYDGRLKTANKVFCKMLGFESPIELMEMSVEKNYVLDFEKRENLKKFIKKYGQVKNFESKWIKKDGSIVYLRETASRPKSPEEADVYYEGIVQDVTENKKGELALLEASTQSKKNEELKAQFLATISHEIRTPLNAIMNFASMLKTDLRDMSAKEFISNINVIEVEGKRIQRTIDLILEMSQLRTGTYNYVQTEFDLVDDIISPIYNQYKEAAAAKGIELTLTNQLVNSQITADQHSIFQIFNQLIDNAIKYTKTGKVETQLFQIEQNKLWIKIIDTGIGIEQEYIPHLFDVFSQEDNSYSRMFEGTGLGLALVKGHCIQNNATIEVESEKEKGTIFNIFLPK